MGPRQRACELFLTSEEESAKFRAVFKKRISFTKAITEEVRAWVAANIVRWKEEKPSWFKIEMIPDEFLPIDVVEAEGGVNRVFSSGILPGVLSSKSVRVAPE